MRISDWSSDGCASDLEKTADSLEQLQRTIARGEEDRASVNHNLAALTERLSSLTDHMRTEQSVMMSIAETQSSLKTLLTRLTDAGQDESGRASCRERVCQDV